MNVKELKEILKDVPDDDEVEVSLSTAALEMLSDNYGGSCTFEPEIVIGDWEDVVEIRLGENLMG